MQLSAVSACALLLYDALEVGVPSILKHCTSNSENA